MFLNESDVTVVMHSNLLSHFPLFFNIKKAIFKFAQKCDKLQTSLIQTKP